MTALVWLYWSVYHHVEESDIADLLFLLIASVVWQRFNWQSGLFVAVMYFCGRYVSLALDSD